ncbi:MAG TPA: hypothetical protein VFV98_10220 [Vicinamibacterales bacterium]|nr:hypothetical protein [Vicinamibacterales bacterium]
MSSFLEMRSLTFDRAGAIIPVPDAIDAPLPKTDWRRSGAIVTASPVALPRTTSVPAVDATAKIKIKKLLPPGTKVRATSGPGFPLTGALPRTLPQNSIGTHPIDFHIELTNMSAQSTGVFVVALTWQFGSTSAGWTTFDTTTHRVLVLADEPAIPWGRPGVVNRVVPWAAVLEQACRWATGQLHPDDCVNAIAKGVYGLGGQTIKHSVGDDTVIEYDGGSSFDNGNGGFFLSNFLDTASLKKDADGFLNCSDLAGAVALLSSAMGCRIGIARVEPTAPTVKVQTHFMQLLGQNKPDQAVFEYHEFAAATSGTGTLGTAAWDACGMLDKTFPPATAAPAASALDVPANWTLKSGTAPVYLTQLLASTQQLKVDLIQHDGILFPEQLPTISMVAVDKFLLQREHDLDALLESASLPTNPVSPSVAANVKTILLKHASGSRERVTWAENRPYANVVARLRPTAGPQTIRMSFTTAGFDAHKIFLRWSARFDSRLVARTGIGHAAFLTPDRDSIVMRVGDTVIHLTGEGKHVPAIDDVARGLANDLKSIYP